MSAFSIYGIVSTLALIFFTMITSGKGSATIKTVTIAIIVFGVVVTLASLGIVTSGTVRLV